MSRFRNIAFLAVSAVNLSSVFCFLSPTIQSIGQDLRCRHGRDRICLFGISEWRDLVFNFPGTGDDRRLGAEQGAPPKEVNILPFPYEQVLLQGETKQLRLYENRFIKLFEDTMKKHCGTVAMGLLADAGLIQTVPLCEVEAYNRMDGFGIFVTIRQVGRAQLIEVTQQEPYIKAVCTEIADNIPPNLELPNLLAGNIESTIVSLSSMETKLKKAQEEQVDDSLEEDEEMKRRISIAKLEDRFYHSSEDDEDEDDAEELDRRRRYQHAYEVALETDTQGYFLPAHNVTDTYTPQEMTAISWAAFCTEILPEMDATFRIQALDCDNLFERLKLGNLMLKQKEKQLKEKLKKAGLPLRGEEGSEDEQDDK